MAYIEPPGWYFPARHLLGAALLAADRAAEAEAVYRADLQQHPKAVSVVSAHRARAPASVNPLIHSLTNSGFFLPKSGMICNVERRLRALLHQAGFTQVCGSTSFLTFGTPESLQWLAEIFSRFTLDSPYAVEWLARGWIDRARQTQISTAWQAWAARPDAFAAEAWCEAVGWKT